MAEIEQHHPAWRLDHRVAVVTGGASGIGRAIAETLADCGAAIVVADLSVDGARSVAAGIERRGGRALAHKVDVRLRADLDAAVDSAVSAFGRLDIQCNVAGAPPLSIPLAEVSDDDIDAELAVALKGVLHGCQAAVPAMRAGGGGAIVNMSSTSIDIPAPLTGLYHLGKTAVAAMTRVLALELGPSNIRVKRDRARCDPDAVQHASLHRRRG